MTYVVIVAIVFIIVVLAIVAIGARRDAAVADITADELPPEFAVNAEPAAHAVESEPEPEPEYSWPKMFAPESGRLDDTARLRLIHDLALVRASWCVPILHQAYEEEREPEIRRAAREALTACEGVPSA